MCNVRKVFLLFLLIVSFGSKAEIIEKIDIIGLDTISRGTVLSYTPVEVGDQYGPELNNAVSNSLLKTNLFSEVFVNFSNKNLNIRIKENPTIKYIEFKDYEDDLVLNEEIVNSMIANFDLNVGKIFVKDNLNKLIESLKESYKVKAFYKTKVSLKTNLDEKNRIGIELFFEEGEQALISSMRIDGNKYFDEDDLLDEFEIGVPDFFIINYFTEKDHFSSREFEAGIESLKNKYLESGFLEMQILDSKLNYLPDENKIDIKITLAEGKQFFFGEVKFSGELLNESQNSLRSSFDLKQGDKFERKKIVSGIKKIAELYQNKGYAYADVNSKMLGSSDKDEINIEIQVNLDKRIFINRIEISGNNITQDDVIRRALMLLEGEVYSKTELNESINRIKRLGYFSDVNYELKRHAKNLDKADILISVVETKTGEFTIGLSHSNATGAALTAGISQQNIFGTGNTLQASFSSSDAVDDTSVYFKDPYFNNLGHSISYGFFSKSIDAANLDTAPYILDEQGINFGYGVPVSKDSSVFGETRLSKVDLTCGAAMFINEATQCANNDDMDLNFVLSYTSNTLNDFYFASEGVKNVLKSTLTLPGSDFKYYKLEASHKSYYPVLKDKIFKMSSRVNLASGIGNDDLPFFKRFFEGGSSSVRGFDFNSLGAKYTYDKKPKGGELSFISSVALGSSLKFAGIDNENMRLSAFIDAGTVAEKTSDFTFNDFRSSTGVQFTWLTPIGPIGVHYAQPILKKSSDSTQSFRLDLGASF